MTIRRFVLLASLLFLASTLTALALGVQDRLACRGIDPPRWLLGEPDVVMFGDSHICLTNWAQQFPGTSIVAYGRGGRTTAELSARVDGVLLLKPRLVVFLAGTNDVVRRRSLTLIEADYRKIVARLRPGRDLLLVSIPPCSSPKCNSPEQGEMIDRLNSRIAAIAQETGSGFIDLNAALRGDDGQFDPALTADGAHVNREGLKRWKALLRPWLEPYREF